LRDEGGIDVAEKSEAAWTAGLRAAQASFLDDIAKGVALRTTLEHLVVRIEEIAVGLKGSVLLTEGDRLRFAAAPNLPDAYNGAVDGVLIGEGYGSCGTAAHRRELVVVDDISSDPLWRNYRDIARRYSLGACWSMPIFDRAGDLLGTFALYYDQPRRPTSAELDLVQGFARLAGIAIELRRKDEKLLEAERGLRDLVEDLDVVVWEADADTQQVTFVSRRAEELLGYPLERWYKEPGFWESLIHPDDRGAIVRRTREAAAAGTKYESEYRLVAADGHIVWVHDFVSTKARVGGARLLRNVMANISRQREADEECEKALERLRSFGEPAVVIEEPAQRPQLDGRVPYLVVNAAHARDRGKREDAARRLLVEAGSIVGSTLDPDETLRELGAITTREFASWCAVFLLDGDQRLRCAALCHRELAKSARRAELDRLLPQPGGVPLRLSAVLSTGHSELFERVGSEDFEPGAVRSELLRLLRELGTESAIAVALRRSTRTLGAIVFASARADHSYTPADVTLAEELARRTALAVENGQLYREAQEAILQRERFLAVAAHELRSPLAALQLNIQAIRRQLSKPDFSKESLVSRAVAGEAQSHRLAALIDDLLDVSRIRAGQLCLVPQPLDLVEAAHRVIGRFRDELVAKGVEVVVHAPSSVVGCWDPLRIEQVITNLVSNGIKYGDGKAVLVAVEANEGTAILRVEDHGAGMSPELIRRLFQPFERGVPAGLIRGLGLGLYIAAQLVEAHHGRISVQSSPGAGSTFVVELPREAAA
jgi:PAS domain S-box-containing protein